MDNDYVEVKTTDNQRVFLNPKLVVACEAVPPSARAQGHTRVYAGGFKFSVQEEMPELLKKLGHKAPI
jgi:hypothetical protein